MAAARVTGSVRCPAGDREAICREGATSSSSGIWSGSSGRTGRSPWLLAVNFTARMSDVAVCMARWALRHWASALDCVFARLPFSIAQKLDAGADPRLRSDAASLGQFVVRERAGIGLLMRPSNRLVSRCESWAGRVVQQRTFGDKRQVNW